MKKTLTTAIVAIIFAAAAAAAPSAHAAENELCVEDNMQPMSNPILEVIAFPFKLAVVMTYLPRCLVEIFPTNEEE